MADTKVEEVPVAADAPAVAAEEAVVEKPVEQTTTGDAVAEAQGACRRAPRLRAAPARRRARVFAARAGLRAACCCRQNGIPAAPSVVG